MKNKSKKSSSRLNSHAGCSMVLLLITLLLGVLLTIAGIEVVEVLGSISITNRVTFSSIATLASAIVVSFIALLYIAVKNLGYLNSQFTLYRKVKDERKRVERLITQAEAETATETDNLDYLAEAENMNRENYS